MHDRKLENSLEILRVGIPTALIALHKEWAMDRAPAAVLFQMFAEDTARLSTVYEHSCASRTH